MKILVPVDGSEAAERALSQVIGSIGIYAGIPEIHLLNVQPPIFSGNVHRFIAQDQINEYHREEGEKALQKSKLLLAAAKLAHHDHILVGSVADTIVRFAAEIHCDQIVVGKKGAGLAQLFLGSVAMKVVHMTEIPVLLV